jgi:hypothetical protein
LQARDPSYIALASSTTIDISAVSRDYSLLPMGFLLRPS